MVEIDIIFVIITGYNAIYIPVYPSSLRTKISKKKRVFSTHLLASQKESKS